MAESDTLALELVAGLRDWRAQHPHATLHAIETAVEDRRARLRVALLQEAALASPTADWTAPAAPAPPCPPGQPPLTARGSRTRRLQAPGGQELALTRHYATCPACGTGLFPP